VNHSRREKYEYAKEFGDKPVRMNNIEDIGCTCFVKQQHPLFTAWVSGNSGSSEL
jgi:hypothetical protein